MDESIIGTEEEVRLALDFARMFMRLEVQGRVGNGIPTGHETEADWDVYQAYRDLWQPPFPMPEGAIVIGSRIVDEAAQSWELHGPWTVTGWDGTFPPGWLVVDDTTGFDGQIPVGRAMLATEADDALSPDVVAPELLNAPPGAIVDVYRQGYEDGQEQRHGVAASF